MAQLGQEAQDTGESERAAAEARRHALTLVQGAPPVLSEDAPLTGAGCALWQIIWSRRCSRWRASWGSLSSDADARCAEREDA